MDISITGILPLVILFSLFLVMVIPLVLYIRHEERTFIDKTCPTALTLFDKLDWDGDGILSDVDLAKCQFSSSSTLSREEKQIARHLRKEIERFDHVIKERVWISGDSYKHFLVPEYGISKEDLEHITKSHT